MLYCKGGNGGFVDAVSCSRDVQGEVKERRPVVVGPKPGDAYNVLSGVYISVGVGGVAVVVEVLPYTGDVIRLELNKAGEQSICESGAFEVGREARQLVVGDRQSLGVSDGDRHSVGAFVSSGCCEDYDFGDHVSGDVEVLNFVDLIWSCDVGIGDLRRDPKRARTSSVDVINLHVVGLSG